MNLKGSIVKNVGFTCGRIRMTFFFSSLISCYFFLFLFLATHIMNEHSHNIFVVLVFIMTMHQVIVLFFFSLLCFPKFYHSIQISNVKNEYWFFKPWTFLLGSFFGFEPIEFSSKTMPCRCHLKLVWIDFRSSLKDLGFNLWFLTNRIVPFC